MSCQELKAQAPELIPNIAGGVNSNFLIAPLWGGQLASILASNASDYTSTWKVTDIFKFTSGADGPNPASTQSCRMISAFQLKDVRVLQTDEYHSEPLQHR